ncbi:MAG: tetratricopeptide repeat protein [Geminicoccaceae bacterium]
MKSDESKIDLPRRSASLLNEHGRSLHGPSVAVLPFIELDDESRKNRTGSWLSDDITHHLSRFRHLSVLSGRSHLSAFRQQRALKAAGRTLGTRYQVIGFVRHAADHLEATAFLIDSVSAKRLWSSPYRKPRHCLKAFEDDLATDMATGIALSIDALECARLKTADELDSEPESTPLILLADYLTKHFRRHANERARKLVERALSIDPMSARAHAVLSRTHHLDGRYGWSQDPEKSTECAIDLAELAIRLDPMEATGHAELGMNRHFQREYDAAFAAYHRALDINPNDPDVLADFGDLLISDGTPDLAIEPLTMAIHLRPARAGMYRYYLAGAFDALGDNESIIELLSMQSDNQEGHRMLAASHARLGMLDKAAFHAHMAMKAHPDFSLARWRTILPHRDPHAREQIIEGFERAGLN